MSFEFSVIYYVRIFLTLRELDIMKKSTKAVLLSTFVFPGLGHLRLKAYKSGWAFILVILGSSAVLVIEGTKTVSAIFEKMMNNGQLGELNPEKLFEIARNAVHNTDLLSMKIAMYVLMISYVLSITEAFRLGRKADREEADQAGAEE